MCVLRWRDDNEVRLSFVFLMIRRPPGSTQSRSSAASDVYKRQHEDVDDVGGTEFGGRLRDGGVAALTMHGLRAGMHLSLIHISEPTRPY